MLWMSITAGTSECVRGTFMRRVRNIPSSVLLTLLVCIENVSQWNERCYLCSIYRTNSVQIFYINFNAHIHPNAMHKMEFFFFVLRLLFAFLTTKYSAHLRTVCITFLFYERISPRRSFSIFWSAYIFRAIYDTNKHNQHSATTENPKQPKIHKRSSNRNVLPFLSM